ncbi:hypothetical protein N665_0410s0008 [Sinapis alba]|nr:hypothetical protein N665_0410s0008 [Sinapis alba]
MRNYADHSKFSETPQNRQELSRGSYANLLGISDERDIYNRESCIKVCDHTSSNAPDPIRTLQLRVLGREYRFEPQTGCETLRTNSAAKRAWARVVLGWVTSREVLVLHPFFFFFSIGKCLNFETP